MGAFVKHCHLCGIVFVSVYIDLMTGSQWWVCALFGSALKWLVEISHDAGLRAGRPGATPVDRLDPNSDLTLLTGSLSLTRSASGKWPGAAGPTRRALLTRKVQVASGPLTSFRGL